MSIHDSRLLARTLVTTVASAALWSQAQAAPIGEIIVTAERREAALQDVPLAVTALTAEQVENLQITESEDLQRIVPSLHMFNNITSPTNLSLSMRGGLQQDASLVVAESPIGIYVDDIYVGRLNGNNTTLSDIERIEVLRGPQGTLYGRNTGYGAIKFISRTPGETSWFDATAGAGNDEQVLLRASLGGRISDSVTGSFAAQWKEKGDQYTNVAEGVETGDEESLALRGKLLFEVNDAVDVTFSLSHTDTDHDSLQLTFGSTPGDPDNEDQFTTDDLVFPTGEFSNSTPWGFIGPAPLTDRPQGETKQTIAGLTIAWSINEDTTFKSITGLVKTEDFFHTDFSGVGVVQGATVVDSDQFTQEFQLLGTTMGDRLNYIAGVFFLNEEADQQFGWNFLFNPLSGSLIDTDVDSVAAFGEASFKVTEQLKLTAGLRWTDDSKDFDFLFVPAADPDNPIPIALENDSDEWTPRIGLDYQFNDEMLGYLQAARGFKGGGFSAIALFSPAAVGTYNPETNWTYEAGFKADWLDNRLRTNLAYFFSDIEDIQQNATVVGGGFEFPVQNSGDAEIQGLEFEISAAPVDGLNLFLSGALLDGKYTRLNEASAANAAQELYGITAETPQTPDYTISAGFDYSFDFPTELIGDMTIGADYYKIDDYVTSATNDFVASGWDTWNAFVAVDVADNFEVKLAGRNLADDFIITAGSRALGGFISLPPREVMLSVTYRYSE